MALASELEVEVVTCVKEFSRADRIISALNTTFARIPVGFVRGGSCGGSVAGVVGDVGEVSLSLAVTPGSRGGRAGGKPGVGKVGAGVDVPDLEGRSGLLDWSVELEVLETGSATAAFLFPIALSRVRTNDTKL